MKYGLRGRTLYISDMDGTLLDGNSRVSRRSAEIISELSRRGVAITVATARTPATVEVLLSDVYTSVPAVVMTGAALWDRSEGRYLDVKAIPAGVMSMLRDAFGRHGVSPFVYRLGSDGMLTVSHGPDMNGAERKFYEERRSLARKRFVFASSSEGVTGLDCLLQNDGLGAATEMLSDDRAGNPVLFFGVDDAGRVELLADELKACGELSLSCYRDIFDKDKAFIEVFGAGVSKAAAIQRLASSLNVGRIVVYGDNLNDLPMFAIADEAVAVANAVPEVLAKADRVIGRNTEDAVALDILENVKNI